MSYDILKSIKYGKDNQSFRLKPGDTVANNFFSSKETKILVASKSIQKNEVSRKKPEKVKGQERSRLHDITVMTIPGAKETIEAEFKVANLERYIDQEKAQESPRMDILRYIDRRIKELTGYEHAVSKK